MVVKSSLSGGRSATRYLTDIKQMEYKTTTSTTDPAVSVWYLCLLLTTVTTNVQMKRLMVVKIEMLKNVNRYQLLKTKYMHL